MSILEDARKFSRSHPARYLSARSRHLKKALPKVACLLAIPLLTSCVIYTNHSFSGKRRIDQGDHWIELTVGEIARNSENKWSLFGGVGQHAGEYGINTFKFSVGLPSYQPPPRLEVLQVNVVCNKRWPLKLYHLPKDQEEEHTPFDNSVHELWVESLPSPTHLPYLIPGGSYQIKIHYRLGDQEYDAEWQCIYKTKTQIGLWQMPRCESVLNHHA